MKKSLLSIVLIMVFVFSVFQLSGCYIVDSGKMKNVEGTYELTIYGTNKNEIEARGITLYVVIKSDGSGYYAYSDNDTEMYYSELRCRFIADTEESGKYSYVEIDFLGNGEYEKFGVNSKIDNKTLTYSRYVWKGSILNGTLSVDYTISATLNRVDKATDLSYIKEKFGDKNVVPFGAKNLSGVYFYSETVFDDSQYQPGDYQSPFVYFYINIDCISGVAETWYMLKEDEVKVNKTFSVSIKQAENGYSLTLENTEINAFASGNFVKYLKIPREIEIGGEKVKCSIECSYYGAYNQTSIEEDIELKILSYEKSKIQE